ncbi:MAG TPA: hypothetical protein VLB81_04070 [Gaiellales bacterium]|nr:hypothetical protein [Gaiellales bacterium]
MNVAPTHRPSDAPRSAELTAGAALACAVSPVPALLGIGPTAVISLGPMAAIALSVTTFATTRGRDARSRRAVAGAALAVVIVWLLLFAVFAIELLHG